MPSPPRKPVLTNVVLACVVVVELAVCYVLSIFPTHALLFDAAGFDAEGLIGDAFIWFYAPGYVAVDEWSLCDQLVSWYASWCTSWLEYWGV